MKQTNQEAAEKDYLVGMKYKDIAAKYDVSINTVKSWKTRYDWQRVSNKKNAPPKKRVHTKPKKGAHKVASEVVDELAANEELTEKQKLFCLLYLQRFNATWAYRKAYQCDYETANVNGSRLLVNASIQKQLSIIKQQQQSGLYLTADNILREYAKQAFASLDDVLDYRVHKEMIMTMDGVPCLDTDDNPVERHVSDIFLKPSDEIDWSLIQDIHTGKDGLVVKLYDKQKAMKELLDRLPEPDIDDDSQDDFLEAIDESMDKVWGDEHEAKGT
ncbi:terminase small subunit [Lapidilactobacillus gannanensis]|uniref:Terminase small subunit n=1 Tax=Lapidilactobacillus gannanensis TaxID=2486002 RepID=A0ABW4BQ43_9LACO|nr:terminase small subunit [Lapidilactobacillus gannanensis]